MRSRAHFLLLFGIIMASACDPKIKGDFEVVGSDFILLSDPDALMEQHVSILNTNVSRIDGDLPTATNDITAPFLSVEYDSETDGIDSMNLVAGLTNNWRCYVDNPYRTTVAGMYLKVVGASSYFRIPLTARNSDFLRYSIQIQVPQDIAAGRLDFTYGLYDAQGNVGRYFLGKSEVIRLGGDFLQVALTWDTDSTDLDLYVTEPDSTVLYYGNRHSDSGGEFFQDHQFGRGPEIARWLGDAPDGEYSVMVDYYWDESTQDAYGYSWLKLTRFVVRINYHSLSSTFEFSDQVDLANRTLTAVTFEKNGSTLSHFQKRSVAKNSVGRLSHKPSGQSTKEAR